MIEQPADKTGSPTFTKIIPPKSKTNNRGLSRARMLAKKAAITAISKKDDQPPKPRESRTGTRSYSYTLRDPTPQGQGMLIKTLDVLMRKTPVLARHSSYPDPLSDPVLSLMR